MEGVTGNVLAFFFPIRIFNVFVPPFFAWEGENQEGRLSGATLGRLAGKKPPFSDFRYILSVGGEGMSVDLDLNPRVFTEQHNISSRLCCMGSGSKVLQGLTEGRERGKRGGGFGLAFFCDEVCFVCFILAGW